MLLSMTELVSRDIIDITTGEKVGRLSDLEVSSDTAQIKKLVVFGKRRFFGILGRSDDVTIDWEDISLIGADTILVKGHSGNRRETFRNRMPVKSTAMVKIIDMFK